jgi:ribosomal protein S12 methylthiotransferase accessory factor
MGKGATPRAIRPADLRSSVLVLGADRKEAFGRSLAKAFGTAIRFLQNPNGSDFQDAELAVGISRAGDRDEQLGFAASTRGSGLPALGVILGAGEALIGPLALPGRAGCGRCAWERLTAAAASAEVDSEPATTESLGDLAEAAAPLLVREIRSILRRGPEASRLLGQILAIDGEGATWSLHRVIPLSRCAVCGGAAAFPPAQRKTVRLSPADPPEKVLAALAGWLDPRTGVVSRFVVEPNDAGPDLPLVATAAPPHVVEEDGSLRRLPIGWGKGLTLSGAILSAVGEAIERYAPSLPDPARIVWERPEDLDGEVLDPRDFALYTGAQYAREGFPYVRFDPGVRHPWVLGRWLGSEAPVWVPAIFTFLSLELRRENLICQGTSNGLAAATDAEEAALRATLELVERDAFMAAWLTSTPGRPVEIGDDPLLRRLLNGLAALGATIELYVLPTSACGTAALCLALGDGERYPGVTIGLGADLEPRAALLQAMLELAQTGPHLRRMMRSNALQVPGDPREVREMLDHASYYFPAERAAAFDRLRGGGPPVALGDLAREAPPRSLASCAAALAAAGIRVALVDVTSPDVATGPFHVLRAVSPDLQPISYGHGLDRPPVEHIRARGLASEIPAIHPIW